MKKKASCRKRAAVGLKAIFPYSFAQIHSGVSIRKDTANIDTLLLPPPLKESLVLLRLVVVGFDEGRLLLFYRASCRNV